MKTKDRLERELGVCSKIPGGVGMNRAQHEEAERPKVETWASRRWGSFGQLPVSRNRKHRYWTRHSKSTSTIMRLPELVAIP